MAHVLIVDDEQSICWGLTRLSRELGHTVATAASAEEGLAAVDEQTPDVVVLDVRLPGMDGLTAMHHFQQCLRSVPIVLITAYGQLETAVTAIRNGAFEYLVKPFELHVARNVIERALRFRSGQGEAPAESIRGEPRSSARVSDQIVGRSPAMQEVFKQIALVAPSEACVHLVGESGTGKELVARAIHRYSPRAEGSFIPVNLASLSPTVAESELFGHVRGAFTGADQSRTGLLELADGGTIFLDEVADVPEALQVKLLRALEHGEIWPVGADTPRRTDFRVISATHQDLRQLMTTGEFRHDLYFRLIAFEIAIPPLRERTEDIAELTQHFLEALTPPPSPPGRGDGGEGDDTARPLILREALSELERRPWYGNVRELRNAIEHALILARGEPIGPAHLPPPAPASLAPPQNGEPLLPTLIRQWAKSKLTCDESQSNIYHDFLQLVEPPLLEAALQACGGQYAAAARRLGLHRTTLKKKLDEFGLLKSSRTQEQPEGPPSEAEA